MGLNVLSIQASLRLQSLACFLLLMVCHVGDGEQAQTLLMLVASGGAASSLKNTLTQLLLPKHSVKIQEAVGN